LETSLCTRLPDGDRPTDGRFRTKQKRRLSEWQGERTPKLPGAPTLYMADTHRPNREASFRLSWQGEPDRDTTDWYGLTLGHLQRYKR
jgi:hypothetical protein